MSADSLPPSAPAPSPLAGVDTALIRATVVDASGATCADSALQVRVGRGQS